MSDSGFHSGLLGSSLAYGTVGVLVGAEEVPEGAGAAVTNDTKRVVNKKLRLYCILKRASGSGEETSTSGLYRKCVGLTLG
jgi:hypothetical protein